MTLHRGDGSTTFEGPVRDQAELQGLIDRVADHGLEPIHGRARGGGDLGDRHFLRVWDSRDGKLVRSRDFTDEAAKLAAASAAT